jgi:hypothetical protein
MKKQTRVVMTGLALAGALCSSTAFAADVVLETPITYAPGAGVVERVRQECHIEDDLEKYLSAVVSKTAQRKGTGEAGASVLRVEISYVFGVGGGGWSGPKGITVNATLTANGTVQRQGKVTRYSMGGVWGPFKGTCSILSRNSQAIAKDLGRWIKDVDYVMPTEAPSAKAASAPAEGNPAVSDQAASAPQ